MEVYKKVQVFASTSIIGWAIVIPFLLMVVAVIWNRKRTCFCIRGISSTSNHDIQYVPEENSKLPDMMSTDNKENMVELDEKKDL